jgi:hypothetical protein
MEDSINSNEITDIDKIIDEDNKETSDFTFKDDIEENYETAMNSPISKNPDSFFTIDENNSQNNNSQTIAAENVQNDVE